MSQDAVIKRFKEVHGDRYNYDHVQYLGNTVKVCIICKEHGEFWQNPADHKSGKGCVKCGRKHTGKKRLTTQVFISKSIETHGDKYDYSESEYIDAETKVKIICNKHGSFWQLPYAHFGNKQGCPSCSFERTSERCKLDIEYFINRATEVHKDTYEYSKAKYDGSSNPLTIICRQHGEFQQTPDSHYAGSGCPTCAKYSPNRKITQEEFETRSAILHDNFYNYSETKYTGGEDYLDIIYPKHGTFNQRASHHMNGIGCPSCGRERISESLKLSQDEVIRRAISIHGDDYSYENMVYIRGEDRANVTCRKHGIFSIRPNNLLTGYGCPSCSRERRNLALRLPHTLYVLQWENVTKIGITNRKVEDRIYEINRTSGRQFKVLKEFNNLTRGNCFQLETEMLNLLRCKYFQVKDTFDGSSECFEDVHLAWLINTIEDKIKCFTKVEE